MAKLFKIISRNKKTLILVLGLGLFLSFLPFQFIKSSLVSVADASFYCEPLGGISQNYRCIGTIPSSACNNLINTNTNCPVKCRDAGGVTARWGTITSWEPYNWYCCNLASNASCGSNNSITLNTAPNPVDLTTGTMSPPVSLEGCSWTNPVACFGALANYLLTLPIRTGALFITIPLAIIALSTGISYIIITILLGWFKTIVLSVPILPGQVDVVQAGWEITRNLANMGFILILVFIGLATILRIKDYEAKKLLPTLIIVALLINFSPVIVGFVVDISNLITNFFLNLGSWESTATVWSMIWNYFADAFAIMTQMGQIWAVIGNIIGTIILGVVLILFFGYSAWIYLLVAALLVVRIIILWILMILAPLAFLFYVLPAGKKLAKEWWQNLVQWAILAIPLGFFLFLSFKVLETTTQVGNFFRVEGLSASTSAAVINGGGIDFGNFTSQLANAFGSMLVPLVSIVILHIGYKLSKSYMPAAAKGIISGVEKVAKMAAGAALVVATGGAAAGLAVRGLGGIAKGAQGVENFMGRVPLLGKPLKALSKPMSWATRGMEKAATPALLEYQAKTRRVPEADLKKIDSMAPADAKDYIEAIDAKIPTLPGGFTKGLKKQHRLQYQARMAEKETLEFTSPEFQDDAAKNAGSIIDSHDLYYQKEAAAIAKNIPDKVFANDPEAEKPEDREKGNERYIRMKTFMKTGNALAEAEKEAREELKKTKDEIERRISIEDATIEVGLKLKYITKEEVDKDRALALPKAKTKGVTEEIAARSRNASVATATYVKEFKPEDVKKLADPDTLGTRVGLTLGNPRNLQKVQDNFGRKKFESVIEGRGGLDDATNTPEKLDEFCSGINPQMGRAVFIRPSPAMNELAIKGREHMRDTNGQPTTNPDAYGRKLQIDGVLDKSSKEFKDFYKEIGRIETKIKETEEIIKPFEIEKKKAELEGRKADMPKAQNEINKLIKEIENYKIELAEKIHRLSPDMKKNRQEIERLKGEKKPKQRKSS